MYENQKLSVKKCNGLSIDDFEHLTALTAGAFANDPSFRYLFSSQDIKQKFIGTYLKFFHNSGQMYICVNECGEICGVSCWVDSNGENLSKSTMKKYGVMIEFKQIIRSLPIRSLYRFIKLSILTDKHHIKQPHSYLVIIASFQKGAGTVLMNDYIQSS